MTYAGFWKRFAAYLIDMIVIYIVVAIVGGLLAMFVDISHLGQSIDSVAASVDTATATEEVDALDHSAVPVSLIVGLLTFVPFLVLFPALYFILQEGSRHQATLGKRCLGIKVCDLQGAGISRWRAFGRYFCKSMSGYVLVGYLFAAFTSRKQALHDLMIESIVVNAPRTHQTAVEDPNAAAQAAAA